jgi:hypothetical protein
MTIGPRCPRWATVEALAWGAACSGHRGLAWKGRRGNAIRTEITCVANGGVKCRNPSGFMSLGCLYS